MAKNGFNSEEHMIHSKLFRNLKEKLLLVAMEAKRAYPDSEISIASDKAISAVMDFAHALNKAVSEENSGYDPMPLCDYTGVYRRQTPQDNP